MAMRAKLKKLKKREQIRVVLRNHYMFERGMKKNSKTKNAMITGANHGVNGHLLKSLTWHLFPRNRDKDKYTSKEIDISKY